MTGRDRRQESLETLAVLAAGLFLLGGFESLFNGSRWVVLVLSVLVPTAAVIILVRLLAPALATLGGVICAALLVVWVFAPGTSFLGLPTAASIAALGDLIDRARVVIVEEAAPIPPPDSVVLIVVIAFAVTLVLGDAVARQSWRVPLLGVLWATMLVVPSVISMQVPPWWVFVGVALMWLWLWWAETPHVGLLPGAGAVLTGAGALAFALVVPAVAPQIEPTSSDLGVTDSEVFGRGINPMIELGRNLRQADGRRVLTYTTDAGRGQYLKAAVLRRFDGDTWSPSPVFGDLEVEGVDDIAAGVEVEEVTTNIRIESLRSTFLPVPYPATQIRGLEGEWQWLRDGSTVRAETPTTTEDQTYTVTSLDRQPTAEQIRAIAPPGDSMDAYRALPGGIAPIIPRLANQVAGEETTDYDRMLALQEWLRSEFTYSEEAPVEQGFDGNGLEAMAEFLRERSGYCVHFASTLAVMGRLLDVPTRVAVGYAPGDTVLRRTVTQTTYAVNSDELHAWTEAYFPEIGWIPFDATPGIGEPTAFSEPEDERDGAGGAEVPEVPQEESGEALDAQSDAATGETAREESSPWRPAALAVLVVAVLGAVPGAVRQLRRRRRWNAGERSPEPLWAEVADTARDLGVEPDPAETPRGFARRLQHHGAEPESLGVLVAELERDRYAQQATRPRVTEARRVVDSLESAQGRRARWLARIVPRSLVR